MKKIKYLCYTATQYALLLYLLQSSFDIIKRTLFVIDENMPDVDVQNSYYIKINKFFKSSKWITWVYLRYVKWFKLPRMNDETEIFAQDHMPFSSVLIGNMKYTIIEDSPLIFSSHYKSMDRVRNINERQKIYYPILRILYGNVYLNNLGENNQCKKVILTIDDPVGYLNDKKKIKVNLVDRWHNIPLIQQNYILRAFNTSFEDMEKLRNKSIIIFTQPLYTMLPMKEHLSIYKKMINKYPLKDVVIKPHPADNTDYRSIFPEIEIYSKKIPSQLFSFMGMKFDKAVTATSTAVFSVNSNIIDWYGTCNSEILKNEMGEYSMPDNINFCEL